VGKKVTFALALLLSCARGPEPIGVAECDAFLTKASACASVERAQKLLAASWKDSARDPSMRPQLVKTCVQALADVRRVHPECSW
jgi:hypothetical protein